MEPNRDPALRLQAQEDAEQQQPLLEEDLEAIAEAIKNPKSAQLSDRVLMVVQNVLKAADKKEAAAIFGDLRTATWFVMSQRALQERGVAEDLQHYRSPFQKMKAIVDAVNDVSTVAWAPVSLINKYGIKALAAIGLSSQSKLLGLVATGRYELDAMQKVLALPITMKKGLLSPDFIRSTLEVGRISAQALGYSQTSYFLGIVSASIGAWQLWHTNIP